MDRSRKARLLKTWEKIGLGLAFGAASIALGLLGIRIDYNNAERAFQQRAEFVQSEIAQRIGSTDAVLTSLVGLHHASDDLRSYEFVALSRELLASYRYIQSIAQSSLIPAERRDEFERSMRADGFPQFGITELDAAGVLFPARPREEHFPVQFIEPLDPEFAQLLGFDLDSHPSLRAAIRRAIDTGMVAASPPIDFIHGGRGYLAFKAAYLGNTPPRTERDRRAQASGLVVLHLDADQIFGDIAGKYGGFEVRLESAGFESGDPRGRLFRQAPERPSSSAIGLFGPFSFVRHLEVQGETLFLSVAAQPGLEVIRFWIFGLLVLFPLIAGALFTVALRNHRRGVLQSQESAERLRLNEQRFRDYAEIASDWFWSTDDEHRFTYFSKRLTEATGLRREELLGKTQQDLGRGNLTEEDWHRHLGDLRAHRAFRDFRYKHSGANGSEVWWATSGKPIFDGQGMFIGYRGTGRNITVEMESQEALRLAKEEAELASRAKSEFLANMSHELRTPLNAVIGFAEVIKTDEADRFDKAKYREYAGEIVTAGQHLLGLISDILDLSKIEAGRVDLCDETIDVSETIRSCLVLMRDKARSGAVTLEQDCPAELPPLRADDRMLKQILVNLLSNAVKFTPPGGTVAVKAWCNRRDGYVLQVSDTGIGMSLDDIPRAMTRFVQLEGQMNRRFEGTGLGLPLTKSLVELHGGSMDLQSELGVGTKITVRFPAERVVRSDGELAASARVRGAAS